MSNYVEKIKVGTGAAWPVRDAEAHELLNELATDLDGLSKSVTHLSSFGLGVTEYDSNVALDNYTASGWYAFGQGTNFTFGPHTFDSMGMRVDSIDGGTVLQTIHPNGEPMAELKRHKVDGVWGEWEWVNPPMMLGVEYRTTERFLEEPVYKKIVDLGEIYDNESGHSWEFVSDLDIRGLTSCLDIVLLDGDGNCITNNRTYINDVYADSYDLYVFPTYNAAEDPISNVMAILKYTK